MPHPNGPDHRQRDSDRDVYSLAVDGPDQVDGRGRSLGCDRLELRSVPARRRSLQLLGHRQQPGRRQIYQRLLPTNPGLRDHAINQAVSGSKVTDLDRQLGAAFALIPSPDLVLIQTVDNDIRCDGTDQENYTAFHDALTRIDAQNPDAATLVVSSPWATVAHYVSVVMNQPDAITVFTGAGPCDLFDPSGHPNRTHMAYQQHVIDAYLTQVQNACRQVRTCHYDRGVLAHLKIDADDLTPDYNHLSIAGQAKQAAVEWAVLEPLVNHH